jgi:superfamily II DNA helicase RecQ
LNQELVVYKQLGLAHIQKDQFAPSFQCYIENFESLTKCKACSCFEKVSAYGLCQLCYFYARQGLHENMMKPETVLLPDAQRISDFEELLNFLVKTVFGFQTAHENQKQAIEAYMAGKHTFVIMPTGSGKSLCFWASAILSPKLTIVFEPLIALIQDQMVSSSWKHDFTLIQCRLFITYNFQAKLVTAGIPCGCMYASSTQGKSVQEKVLQEIAMGLTRVLFTTPEKLQKSLAFRQFLHQIYEERGIQFVVDEAHCIIDYKHFR